MSDLARRWLRRDRLLSLAWPNHPKRWADVPGRLRPRLAFVLRLTIAATLTFLITIAISGGKIDLTGPLTALLVMQASAYSTLKTGVFRVSAVLGGVIIASLLSSWVGLTWWSLALAVAASLLLGAALRLGDQLIETPISAMLILAGSNPDLAAEARVLNTLIGAALGIGFNLVFPPSMQTGAARQAVRDSADAVAAPLAAAATAFEAGPLARTQLLGWLDQARDADARVADGLRTAAALADRRRFNPRALGTADIAPVLNSGLRTLDSAVLGVRALLSTVEAEWPEDPDQLADPYGEELRLAFARVLADTAAGLRGFGSLVLAEADGHELKADQVLRKRLRRLDRRQAAATRAVLAAVGEDQDLLLLRGSVLAAVEHIADELDADKRARLRRSWQADEALRPMSHLPLLVQAALPHPDRPTLRGLPPGTLPQLPGLRELQSRQLPSSWTVRPRRRS